MVVQCTFCGECFTTLWATQWHLKSGTLNSCLSWLIWIIAEFAFDSKLPVHNLHNLSNCLGFHGESATDSKDSTFVALQKKYIVVLKTIIRGKARQLKFTVMTMTHQKHSAHSVRCMHPVYNLQIFMLEIWKSPKSERKSLILDLCRPKRTFDAG